MIKPRLARLEAMCAQSRVGWKQVHAGAKGVNVIVAAQEDLWPGMCENGRRRCGGGSGSGCRPQTCKYFTAPPSVMRIQCSRLAEARRRRKETRLEFTRSFPAQGLSKLNKATQAATYQTACMPGLFLSTPQTPAPNTHTPQCLWVWQDGLWTLSGVKH